MNSLEGVFLNSNMYCRNGWGKRSTAVCFYNERKYCMMLIHLDYGINS